MRKPVSPDLLEKYISGRCNSEEIAQVKEWYDSFEEEPDYVSDISVLDEQHLADELYRRIAADIAVNQNKSHKHRFLRPSYAAASIAAVFLIIVGLFVSQKHEVSLNNSKKTASVVKQQIRINNKTRVIYKAVLPDNSIVWLSPGAKLTYPKVFDTAFRLVSMSGECFFEVSKNPHRPFIISSNSIITKVWGTSFRVRDIDGGKSAEVSVLTGKVSVSIKDQNKKISLPFKKNEVMLHSDQKITYLHNQHTLKPQKETKESSVKIWHRVNLSFESVPLKSIVPMLNSSYSARIRIANDELNDYMLTADFEGFNLPEVLNALKKSLNISYEIRNDNVILLK